MIPLLSVPNPTVAAPSPQIGFAASVRIGPPVLPVYVQPFCPGPGYIWVPGYWAFDDDNGYYWVPGTWVLPPEVGLLWTPGYWAFSNGFYLWNAGYWGPVVGFYGGINYGFGYPGTGFYGGYWRGGEFFYNRSVSSVNTTIVHNVYNTTVINNNASVSRASFNGGPGGANARPTQAEMQAFQQRHTAMTSEQQQLQQTARNDRNLFAAVNHGRPDVAATSRPAELSHRSGPMNDRSVSPKRPASNNPAVPRAPERPPAHEPAPAPRPAPVRPHDRPTAESSPTVKPAPVHPSDRPSAHEPPPAVKSAPPHAEGRPAHQPPAPAPARSNERPSHTPPPVARPAPPPAHSDRPPAHRPAPAANPSPAPRPSHPPASTQPSRPSEHKPEHPNG
jgi:hypothetical protein